MANVRIRDQGKITLKDSDNSNEVSLQSPSTVSDNQDFIVPNADGSANNIITTNASGTLSFTDINTLVASDINWNTTPQYANITLVSGTGYFINTTLGPTTMTLPASPSVGDFVALKDYAGTFGTNNLTIDRNGSNIQGSAINSDLTTNRASVVLQYIDATKGWLYVVENNVDDLRPPYVSATGGTITTSGDYKIHTFTSSGTFTVDNAGGAAGSNTVDYLVIAGGAGSGGGGGGAGGFRQSYPNPSTAGLPVSAQGYPITVGAGGSSGSPNAGANAAGDGSNSIFSTITSAGGGKGGKEVTAGTAGGSGGGGNNCGSGGAGNTPPVSPSQGNSGGTGTGPGPASTSGGGGGHNASGGNGSSPGGGGAGGNGTATTINGSPTTFAGGGGGGARATNQPGDSPFQPVQGAGGSGGGGAGGYGTTYPSPSGPQIGSNGTANTGGGAGGSSLGFSAPGASGGSGLVIIRYKYQN